MLPEEASLGIGRGGRGRGKEERTGTGEEDGPLSVDRTRSCRIERVDLTL